MLRYCRILLALVPLLFATAAWAKTSASEILMAQRIHIGQGETRDQDLICLGCKVSIDGKMDGDLLLVGGWLEVNGAVTGDVAVFGGTANVGSAAQIGGDVAVFGGRLVRAPGASIAGDVAAPQGSPARTAAGLVAAIALAFFIPLAVAGVLAVALAFALLGERRIGAVAAAMEQHAALALLAGFVASIAMVFLARALHVLTRTSGSLFFCAVLVFIAALVTGYAGLSFLLGRKLSRSAGGLGAMMIGALIIAAIQIVPVLGWLAFCFFADLALGACIVSGFGSSPNWYEQVGHAAPSPPTGAAAG
ncbi:MAG TPA: hypothetical protein VE998_11155 [Terriglobales bacterium]|nr:hypothetical protein [Terriglobales bacterium]